MSDRGQGALRLRDTKYLAEMNEAAVGGSMDGQGNKKTI